MRSSTLLRTLALVLGIFAVYGMILGGCSGSMQPDPDGAYDKAAQIFPGVSVGDDLDPGTGDKEDWRRFRFVRETEAKITVVMAPLRTNEINGRIGIYDNSFAQITEVPVRPGQGRYQVKFIAAGGADYFVVVGARSGAGPYQIQLDGAPVDPCRSCTADQVCRDGRCVQKPKPCGGCPEDLACDQETDTCVPPACVGIRCRANYFCDKRGRCRKRRRGHARSACPRGQVRRRGKCVPASCPSGQELRGGKCVPEASSQDFVVVTANVVGVIPLGDARSAIVLDKGSIQGLKKGMTGKMKGVSKSTVKVKKVWAARAKAVINVATSEIEGKGRKVILRVPKH